MHEINIETIGFFAAVWAIAFCSTVVRAVRDVDGLNWRNTLSLGATSGFLSFAIACFLVDSSAAGAHSHWYYLGGASLIGLLAREQDRIAKAMFDKFMHAGKIFFADTKQDGGQSGQSSGD